MKITEYPNQVAAGIDPANDLLIMVNLDEEGTRKVTINNLMTGYGVTTSGKAIITAADASAQRTALGLAIGTNVQAYDADLDVWATKTPPSGDVVGTTDTQTLSGKTFASPIVTGQMTAADGIVTSPSYAFSSEPGSGMYFSNSGSQIRFSTTGVGRFLVSSTGMQLPAGAGINWSPSTLGATTDTRIQRDGAGVVAFRNGATSHEVNIYNTYTSSTNHEYNTIRWTSNVCEFGTIKGSAGGTARDLALITDGTQRVTVNATSGDVKINSTSVTSGAGTGALQVGGGAFIAGNVVSNNVLAAAAGYVGFAAKSRLYSSTDGNIEFRNAANSANASITASAATFSGAVNITDTTVSTSSTTGALVVTGGIASGNTIRAAANIFAGAVNSIGLDQRTRLFSSSDGNLEIRNFANTANSNITTAKVTASGDIEATTIATGLILKSPNGTRWRLTVSDAGASVWTSLP